MRRTAAVILIISLYLAVPAIAGQFEDALQAYKHGDYKTAYRLFEPLSGQGARDLTASKMTPAQIAEAQKLAREWKPKKER